MSPVVDYLVQHQDLVNRLGQPLSSVVPAIASDCINPPNLGSKYAACENLLGTVWAEYEATGDSDFYHAVETGFNYVVGPNGIPNTPNIPDVRRDLTSYLVAY
jgi:hypothetical protein